MSDIVAVYLIVAGRVQGVSFRSSMKNLADSKDIVGWVRNNDKGEVEALVQGSKTDVDHIVDWCRRGPSTARVEEVMTEETAVQSNLRNFSVIY